MKTSVATTPTEILRIAIKVFKKRGDNRALVATRITLKYMNVLRAEHERHRRALASIYAATDLEAARRRAMKGLATRLLNG